VQIHPNGTPPFVRHAKRRFVPSLGTSNVNPSDAAMSSDIWGNACRKHFVNPGGHRLGLECRL
jgi:hypothetical protein